MPTNTTAFTNLPAESGTPALNNSTGPARRRLNDQLLYALQVDAEHRDSLTCGFFTVPTIQIQGTTVACTEIDAILGGKTITLPGNWSFAGTDAAGTYFLQVNAPGYTKATTVDAAKLTIGTVVWDGAALSVATVTAKIGLITTTPDGTTQSVTSVNGKTGEAITLTAEDIDGVPGNTEIDARITLQKAQLNGLATLGADGKVPSTQLPAAQPGEGNVIGPASSTVNRIAKYTSTDGKQIGQADVSEAQLQLAVNNTHTHANKALLDAYNPAAFDAAGTTAAHATQYPHADIGKVLVDSTDTTRGTLTDKIKAGSNIALVVDNTGANETLTISATAGAGGGDMLKDVYDADEDGVVDTAAYARAVAFGHFDQDLLTTDGLTFGYKSGLVYYNGIHVALAAGTVTLPDNSGGWVALVTSGDTLAVSVVENPGESEAITTGFLGLYTFETVDGEIITLNDYRSWLTFPSATHFNKLPIKLDATPTNGQVLAWDAALGMWVCGDVSGTWSDAFTVKTDAGDTTPGTLAAKVASPLKVNTTSHQLYLDMPAHIGQYTAVTNDDTPTVIPLDANGTYMPVTPPGAQNFDIRVVAVAGAQPKAWGWNFRGVLYHETGSTTIIGTPTTESYLTDNTCTCTLSASSGVLLVTVTGPAATTVGWTVQIQAL